jgi:hypothetical protein
MLDPRCSNVTIILTSSSIRFNTRGGSGILPTSNKGSNGYRSLPVRTFRILCCHANDSAASYEATEDNEISFNEGDHITEIDTTVSEDWWQGTGPNGHNGLFPGKCQIKWTPQTWVLLIRIVDTDSHLRRTAMRLGRFCVVPCTV